MSQGDLLKIKLQLFQFESDLAAAKLAKSQALVALRQQLGLSRFPIITILRANWTFNRLKGVWRIWRLWRCARVPICRRRSWEWWPHAARKRLRKRMANAI